MSLNETLLTVAALLPAVVLCIYVFRMDRVEKEPVFLLLRLFLLGALCCFPAAYIEGVIIDVIDMAFSGYKHITPDGTAFMAEKVFYLYSFVKYLIGVAVVEEGAKLICVHYITKDNKEFNCLFDGMIYVIFVSLGFAALENVFYVLENGWGNAIMRAVLSVPGHMFFAVMMGYHYSFWHITDRAAEMEEILWEQEMIPTSINPFSSTKSKILSFLIPVTAHTVYNFCCSVGQWWSTLGLYIFVVFMYVHCFRKIKKMSLADAPDTTYAEIMIYKKYPYLSEISQEETEMGVY